IHQGLGAPSAPRGRVRADARRGRNDRDPRPRPFRLRRRHPRRCRGNPRAAGGSLPPLGTRAARRRCDRRLLHALRASGGRPPPPVGLGLQPPPAVRGGGALLLPTTPPWLGKPDQVYKVIDETIRKLHVPGWLVSVYVHHDYNLYAAFPSLHSAFPLIAAAYGWRLHAGLGAFLLAWTFAVWFS